MNDTNEPDDLLDRAMNGDVSARSHLLAKHSERLLRMVELRMDPRLKPRIGASDIVQDAIIEADRRLPNFPRDRPVSFYVWLRTLTQQKLLDATRFHLRKQRNVKQEIRLDVLPDATSRVFVLELADSIATPGRAAERVERAAIVGTAIQSLRPEQREVLVLRHFEGLSNREVAEVLDVSESTASSRYIQAIQRLTKSLERDLGGDLRSVT
jgi:RNA polymerase sigma-70 factor (ECF subfamily)